MAFMLSIFLMVASSFIHYEILMHLNEKLPNVYWVNSRPKVLLGFFVAIISHTLQILLYAIAYYLLRDGIRTGTLSGQFQDVFATYFYFSAETYTSLGLGDIFPLGSLRVMVGFETLTGLLMVSWTASFTYFEMSRYWKRNSSEN